MQSEKNSIPLDYIGMESCVDLKDNGYHGEEAPAPANSSGRHMCRGLKRREEFPPPIPLLVRTENVAAHMPWVLKRHYTDDGRLILTEEKVKHHEYFQAHRSGGRLMLQLIALDDKDGDGFDDKYGNVGNTDSQFMFGVGRPGSLRSVQS